MLEFLLENMVLYVFLSFYSKILGNLFSYIVMKNMLSAYTVQH